MRREKGLKSIQTSKGKISSWTWNVKAPEPTKPSHYRQVLVAKF
jgi:hypothetical protein